MCAACDTRRDAIEPRMRPMRPMTEPVVVDFGFGGVVLDIPAEAEEYLDHSGAQDALVRGCGPLFAGGWVAIEARRTDDLGQYQVWEVRRFYRATHRGEALDNLDLWAQIALVTSATATLEAIRAGDVLATAEEMEGDVR